MNPVSIRASRLFAVLLASLAASGVADALVVRHDVADAAYLARESEFPAVFSLYRTRADHPDCLATLIAPRHALTAAHCTDVEKLRAAIDAGTGFRVDIAGRADSIVAVFVPPLRADGSSPDVAILQLGSPVDGIEPIAPHAMSDEVGRIVLMPGWGGTGTGKTGAGASDGFFRVAENRVDRAENGRLYWVFDDPATGRALTLEGISGPGDSGGPALMQTVSGWEIVGVSSAQRNGDGAEGVYGVEEVFVRVSDLTAWIDRVIRSTPD